MSLRHQTEIRNNKSGLQIQKKKTMFSIIYEIQQKLACETKTEWTFQNSRQPINVL